jgi:hypothetical protein
MKKRKKYNPAQRLQRLALNYGFESRDSWGQREGKEQYDIYWMVPMNTAQKVTTLRQIFGALQPGATLSHYENVACRHAATYARKWWVRVQVYYKLGIQDRVEETDYQLEDSVQINQLQDFHNATVAEMKTQITSKSKNAVITDVRWLALPRPLPKAVPA